MKNIHFNIASKGGVGKSIFTFLASVTNPDYGVVDLDENIGSASKFLKFKSPVAVKVLGQSGNVEYELFNDLIEKLATGKKQNYLCDTGGTISEKLPHYFGSIDKEEFTTILKELDIKILLNVIIGGADIFNPTIDYLKNILEIVHQTEHLVVRAFCNKKFPLSDEQQAYIETFTKEKNITCESFTLTEDFSELTQKRVTEVLEKGEGIDGLSPIKKIKFTKGVNTFPKLQID